MSRATPRSWDDLGPTTSSPRTRTGCRVPGDEPGLTNATSGTLSRPSFLTDVHTNCILRPQAGSPVAPPLAIIVGALAWSAWRQRAAGVVELAFVVAFAGPSGSPPAQVLSWPTLLCGIVLVILFFPIRRYTIPGGAAL